MNIKRIAKNFACGVLVPAFTYTILERLTEHVVVAVGGTVTIVTLAFFIPAFTTGLRALDDLIERLRGHRRSRSLDYMCTFLNTYTRILTKYPPALLPKRLSHCIDAQIDAFVHSFESLQERRTQTYATPYDMIRTLRFRRQDFHGWRLGECEAWWIELLSHLSQIPGNPMKRALQLGMEQAESHLWQFHFETAEQRFDDALKQSLAKHPLLQRIHEHETLRQRVITLIQTDTVPGQAHLQNALQRDLGTESEDDVEQLVALLRHDVVTNAILSHLTTHDAQPRVPVHSGQNPW